MPTNWAGVLCPLSGQRGLGPLWGSAQRDCRSAVEKALSKAGISCGDSVVRKERELIRCEPFGQKKVIGPARSKKLPAVSPDRRMNIAVPFASVVTTSCKIDCPQVRADGALLCAEARVLREEVDSVRRRKGHRSIILGVSKEMSPSGPKRTSRHGCCDVC